MLSIDDAVRLWALTDVRQIADTPGSRVYRCRTPQGASTVVKVLKPRGLGEASGMDFLAWREGRGAVRLIRRKQNIALLEDGGELTLEEHRRQHGESAADAAFAALLPQLHAPSPFPPPASLVPLEQHFEALLKRRKPADPSHADNFHWAADLTRRLLSVQVNVKPLHGDLHHENIISRDGMRWVAVDPHGLIGDPAYDVANYFGNPLHTPDVTLNPERILSLAERLAPLYGKRKILEYAAAHAALSATWSIDDPVTEEDLADARDRLRFLAVVRGLMEAA